MKTNIVSSLSDPEHFASVAVVGKDKGDRKASFKMFAVSIDTVVLICFVHVVFRKTLSKVFCCN